MSAWAKCSMRPAPPDAITGIDTASATARVNSRSYPSRVPSRSMLVSKISPAPRASASRAHSTALRSVPFRPPCVYTRHLPLATLFASIATTTHCDPNFSAAAVISGGFSTAAVFTATLSAPASRIARKSSSVRTPPPTANGMNTWSATRRTTSSKISRRSNDAVISRKTSSSAPAASYARPCSTGSPASRNWTKFTPLTTRPSFTSRHGMIRLANMFLYTREKSARRQKSSLPAPPNCDCLFQLHRARIKGLPNNHPFDSMIFTRLQRFHIAQTRDAARRDHAQAGRARQFCNRFCINAAQHSIARDISVNDACDATLGHLIREVDGGNIRQCAPAVRCRHSIAHIDPNDDAPDLDQGLGVFGR